jgi:hypothetical protein
LFIAIAAATHPAHALDAVWWGQKSQRWDHGIDPVHPQLSNWYSAIRGDPNAVARNVPDGTATFTANPVNTQVQLFNQNITIGRMRFTEDAPLYSFLLQGTFKSMTLNGLGVVNFSAFAPSFLVANTNTMQLQGSARLATAGSARSARIETKGGTLYFGGMARGGDAEVINLGTTSFSESSSAEQMSILNRGSVVQGGGRLHFRERATGDRADITNEAAGQMFVDNAKGPAGDNRLPIGKVDNGAKLWLGLTKLVVGRTYVQAANGTLALTVRGTRTFGTVIAKLGARLGGDLIVDIAAAHPGTFTIVQVTGGPRVGQFAKLTLRGRNDLKGRLAYSGRAANLILERK